MASLAKPRLLLRARDDVGLDMARCVLVGDRATDIEAGSRARVGKLALLPHATGMAPCGGNGGNGGSEGGGSSSARGNLDNERSPSIGRSDFITIHSFDELIGLRDAATDDNRFYRRHLANVRSRSVKAFCVAQTWYIHEMRRLATTGVVQRS